MCGAVLARSLRVPHLIVAMVFLLNFDVCSYIGGSKA